MRIALWFLVGGILLALAGCDATVELTKAPFDESTALSDGVTQASKELVQPTTELTSSTTPGADGVNNPARARKRLEMFAAYSHENLRSDVSRGDGEYLISLATLAGVPQERHEDFRLQMRNAYPSLFDEALSTRDSSARVVNAAWAMGRGSEGRP